MSLLCVCCETEGRPAISRWCDYCRTDACPIPVDPRDGCKSTDAYPWPAGQSKCTNPKYLEKIAMEAKKVAAKNEAPFKVGKPAAPVVMAPSTAVVDLAARAAQAARFVTEAKLGERMCIETTAIYTKIAQLEERLEKKADRHHMGAVESALSAQRADIERIKGTLLGQKHMDYATVAEVNQAIQAWIAQIREDCAALIRGEQKSADKLIDEMRIQLEQLRKQVVGDPEVAELIGVRAADAPGDIEVVKFNVASVGPGRTPFFVLPKTTVRTDDGVEITNDGDVGVTVRVSRGWSAETPTRTERVRKWIERGSEWICSQIVDKSKVALAACLLTATLMAGTLLVRHALAPHVVVRDLEAF